jgi:hypothetical protein
MVDSDSTTVLLPPAARAIVDRFGSLVLTHPGGDA